MVNKQMTETQEVLIRTEEYLPEALFLNLRTQKIESIRPDRLTQTEQYVLLSDLFADTE